MSDSAHPDIPGWSVALGDDGSTWTASRRGGLSATQRDHGCRLVVGASSPGELLLACTAEDMKATVVVMVELLAERMAERGSGQ